MTTTKASETFLDLFEYQRNTGCTQLLVDSLRGYKGPKPLVLVHNIHYAREVKHRFSQAGHDVDVESIESYNTYRERGIRRPILVDMTAVGIIAQQAISERCRANETQRYADVLKSELLETVKKLDKAESKSAGLWLKLRVIESLIAFSRQHKLRGLVRRIQGIIRQKV